MPVEGPPVPCAGWGLASPPTWLGKVGSPALQRGEPALIHVARPSGGAQDLTGHCQLTLLSPPPPSSCQGSRQGTQALPATASGEGGLLLPRAPPVLLPQAWKIPPSTLSWLSNFPADLEFLLTAALFSGQEGHQLRDSGLHPISLLATNGCAKGFGKPWRVTCWEAGGGVSVHGEATYSVIQKTE